MSKNQYLTNLRNLAQSILAGVQRLEDQTAVDTDDSFANLTLTVAEADSAVWSTVEHIENGRVLS